MYAVSPKYDCPHEYHIDHLNFIEYLTANFSKSSITNTPCKKCSSNANFSSDPKSFENWICLTCYEVHCSRFICSHMHQHNREMNSIDEVPTASNLHPIAMSFTDGSFWCYACDSYIYSATFRSISERFGILKHPSSNNNMHPEHPPLPPIEEGEEEERDDLKNYDSSYYEVGSNSLASFTVEELVENMRDNRYLNICFVVGAGISVAAGIPDFRSPGGIYSKIRELNIPDLSTPEALFSLDLLQSRPELFFTLGRDLVKTGYQPVKAHKFISHCASKGIVKMVFSQNIDSLELDAGLSPDLLVQVRRRLFGI
jgi:NAD-dependent histone deacetylase SIR2